MKRRLIGMTWDHPRAYDSLLEASAQYAARRDDVEIEWERRSLQAFADQPIEDLAARHDLIIMDHPHVGNAAEKGCLVALDGRGYDDQLSTLAAQSVGHSYQSYRREGHQWALPVDAASQVAAYRADLLADADVPRTWLQTIELAQQGKVLWPMKPVDSMMSFFSLAANRCTPCGEGARLIAEQDGVAVLEAMAALRRHVPDDCLQMNPIDVAQRLVESDRFAYSPLLFGYSNYARDGFRPRLLRYTNIPALGSAGPCGAILGGAGIAVSSRGRHIDVAVDFAYWVCNAECQAGVYFEAGGQPGNAAAWDDDVVNAACHNFFRATRETLDRSYLRPCYDGFLDLQDQGGNIIHGFLSGHADAANTISLLHGAYQESRRRSV